MVYRIYNDEGYPMFESNGLITKTDILKLACEESKRHDNKVITVWRCDPKKDYCEKPEWGIFNDDQRLVANYYQGRQMIL